MIAHQNSLYDFKKEIYKEFFFYKYPNEDESK